MAALTSQALIGREEPLRALAAALGAAAAGRPSLTLLAGEAGVGKTRLASEAEARARALGFLVLHGECLELGGDELAYAPVMAALRDLPADWLADALDELPREARAALGAVLPREPAAGAPPGRLFELLLGLLGRLSAEVAPVLVVLEDIHWADRSTRELLAFLARNLRAERLAAIATLRTGDELVGEPRRLATELARRRIVTRIDLEPLSRPDVARQLEAIAGRPVPASLADEVHARAGGNPFFVEELFAAHGRGDVPDSVADAVLLRVERLGPGARETLELVAAAGGRIDHALLEGAEGVRAALDAGLLVREPGDRGVAFRHGLIGEVLYGRLLPGERTALHRRLAAALEGAPAAQLAVHCHRAGMPAEALAASVAAGLEAAAMHAYGEAGAHLERALELWDDAVALPVDRVEVLAQAAQAARFAGHPERAVALYREALGHAVEPARAAALYERLGECQFWDDEAALECYGRALDLAGEGPERARLLAAEGHALMGLRRWEEARERCEAALEAGAKPRITLGLVLAHLGDAEAGEAHLRRALELAESGEDTARAYMHLGELLRVRGDHAAALATMAEGEQAAARLGLRGSFGHFMYVNAIDDLVRLGRWGEAAERLAEAERMDLGRTAAVMRRATAGQLHALRGELDAARGELVAPLDPGLPSEFAAPLAGARAALALAEGDPAACLTHLEPALALPQDPFYTPPLYSLALRAEAELAERQRAARRAAGDERARALLAGLDALLARAPGGPDARAHRALAQAELARVAGEPAPERWHAVAARWDALAEPHPAAYARVQEAEAILLAGGDRAAATAPLSAAHAAATALGAAPLRDAAEALGRRARLTLAAAPPAPPAGEAPHDLTEREAEVLRLLAQGLTNREIADRLFISQKTVSTHLAHIFGKLDVHTRVEAAGRARAIGVL